MHAMTLIHGIGSIGLFSSRAFVPAFLTALLLKYGPEVEWLKQTGMLDDISGAPSWFTHWATISILGGLSMLEVAATKSPEAREALNDVDKYLKSGMATLTSWGVLSVVDAQFIEQVAPAPGMAAQPAGFLGYMFSLVILLGTFFATTVRSDVVSLLIDADDSDEVGIQGLISWAEDIWSSVGVILLVLYPLVMIAIIGVVMGVFVLMRKYAAYREEKSKVACGSCGTMMYPTATACPSCKTEAKQPHKIGLLGGAKSAIAEDRQTQQYALVEHKRCPVCATRFEQRDVRQTCGTCGHELMADESFARAYMGRIDARLPLTLGVSFLFSLIPIVGLIPGVIFYRIMIVAPFRRYLPLGRRFFLKWLIRIVFLVLILLQVVPGVGGFVVPAMALLNYTVYRSSYRGLALERG